MLIGIVTSVPELASGVSAVTLAEAPELAVGPNFGACIFNLSIIVILVLLYRRGSIYHLASRVYILSAAFGMVLICFCGLGIRLALNWEVFAFGHIGVYSPFLISSVFGLCSYDFQLRKPTDQGV